MKDLIEKYFVFTLVFIALVIALFVFKDDKDLVLMIIGAFVGLLTAPTVYPKGTIVPLISKIDTVEALPEVPVVPSNSVETKAVENNNGI